MYGQVTFFHQGHELMQGVSPYLAQLTSKLQNARETFVIKEELTSKLVEDVSWFSPPAE